MSEKFVSDHHKGEHSEGSRSGAELMPVRPVSRFAASWSGSAEANTMSQLRRLFVPAVIFAVFSAAIALIPFGYSHGLEAQSQEFDTQEESPESARQLYAYSVPARAIELYHNCNHGITSFPFHYWPYIGIFSTRNQSSCSGYEDGDYILKVDSRFVSFPRDSDHTNARSDLILDFYVVGSVPGAGEADTRVDDFTYYINSFGFTSSASFCGTNQESTSLSIVGSDVKTTSLCRIEIRDISTDYFAILDFLHRKVLYTFCLPSSQSGLDRRCRSFDWK